MASSLAPGDTSRDINIVSGDCHVFPVTWTLKVYLQDLKSYSIILCFRFHPTGR